MENFGIFIATWNVLLAFWKIYDLFVYFVVILSHFGMLYQEKSGNPAS
jgi:hypothetical protein